MPPPSHLLSPLPRRALTGDRDESLSSSSSSSSARSSIDIEDELATLGARMDTARNLESANNNGCTPASCAALPALRDESTIELLRLTGSVSEDSFAKGVRRASSPCHPPPTNNSASKQDADIELGGGSETSSAKRRRRHFYVRLRSALQAQLASGHVAIAIRLFLAAAWLVYLVAAVRMNRASTSALLSISGVFAFALFARWAWPHCRPCVARASCGLNSTRALQILFVLLLVGVGAWLLVELIRRPEAVTSLLGLCVIVSFMFLASRHPHEVRWRPVVGGLLLQLLLGALVLKWDRGAAVFQAAGELVAQFFSLAESGILFVFGAKLTAFNTFAFAILPLIIFFSSFISVLYHFGAMQAVVQALGSCLQFLLGTSAAESVCVAANIFIGQTEAPLLIKPLLKDMTMSEMHAVMTGGFATIAGTVLGMYISQGVPAAHLIAASVMAAPGALASSKLFYPETEQSRGRKMQMPDAETSSVVDAISQGASTAIGLLACIGANLIAFLAMLAFVNAVLAYLGARVGVDDLSFEMICGVLFMPLAFMLGIPWSMCGTAGQLIGTKIFINEFVAYGRLSEYWQSGALDDRSATILTYALCGFANVIEHMIGLSAQVSSIGIQVGGISALVPSRRQDLAHLAVRALIAGTLTNFMTACLAGILLDPGQLEIVLTNTTMTATPLPDASVGL